MTQTTEKMSDSELQQTIQIFKAAVESKKLSVDEAKAKIKAAKEDGTLDEKQAQQLYQAVAEASKGGDKSKEASQQSKESDKKPDNKSAKKESDKKDDGKKSEAKNANDKSEPKQKIDWVKLIKAFTALVVMGSIFITLMMFVENVPWPFKQPARLAAIFIFIAIMVGLLVLQTQFFFPAFLFFGIVYTFALCFENYWLIFGGISNQAFVPKLFVDDGWNLDNLFNPAVYMSLVFIVTLIIVGLIQGFESEGMRQLGWVSGKRKIKDRNKASMLGKAIYFFIGLDLVTGLPHYSLLDDSFVQILVNLVYLVISVVGTEVLANVLLIILEE